MGLTILVFAILGYSVLYIGFAGSIAFGEKRLKSRALPDELPRISVVVCARDEESNIRRCLDHLVRIDYPRDRLEIFLVDDESTDNTLAIMGEYAAREQAITVLSTEREPHDLPGKQRPLNLGIRESSGEYIFITDADIAVSPGWIKGHLAAYDDTIGIVGATTRVDHSSGRFFDRVQCVDLVSKHAVAMGCAGLGVPLSIMGNNISFRRSAYDTVGGYAGLNCTVVEDMALMNAVVTRTPYTLAWAPSPDSVVTSEPEKDLAAFINQRYRWVYEVTDLSAIGKVMLAMEFCMIMSWALSVVIAGSSVLPFLAATGAWIAGYAVMLVPQPGRGKNDMLYIPAMIAFQLVYGLLLAKRAMFGKKTMVWKGRSYTKQTA